MSFWAPKDLCSYFHFSGSAITAHIAHLIGSVWLHPMAASVLGGGPMLLASPKHGDLHRSWADSSH
ncbi:hypothetical protein I79_025150 [Cricetulus griseus]|uniref:Uncharacterized protein n=1 Tax=Cricetulus griseus TaxID=10029 RepID=G3IML0_CRIGR|nr:hypothetical protein I79_025150 [Cricetulus griseus]